MSPRCCCRWASAPSSSTCRAPASLNQMVEGIGESQGIIQWLFETSHRGQRSAAAAAVHRHRRDDRLRPAALKSQNAALRRGGAVRHLLHHASPPSCSASTSRTPLPSASSARRTARPPSCVSQVLHSQLRRRDRRRGVLLHGAGADHPALRHQAGDDEKGAPHPDALQPQERLAHDCASASRSS